MKHTETSIGSIVRQIDRWYSNYPAIFTVKDISPTGYVIVEENIYDIDAIQLDCLELWQPKNKEWIWVWDNLGHPHLRKFKKFSNSISNHPTVYPITDSAHTESFYHYEPYIGSLPYH